MTVTKARRTARPAGLDASTVAEAFQLTAQAHPERCALRLKHDELLMSWSEYATRSCGRQPGSLDLAWRGARGDQLTTAPSFKVAPLRAPRARPFWEKTYALEQSIQCKRRGQHLITERPF